MWIARIVLLLFVVKMHWGMWETWEWTLGDEPEHLYNGVKGIKDFDATTMDWSPLYRYYFGLVFLQSNNALLATIVHRLVVVFAAVFVTFEALRRIIPLGVSLLICIWWAAIPSDLNPLYTVHVFAHLMSLIALLGFAVCRRAWGKGVSLSVLAVSTLFVRTETLVTLGVVGLFLLWELWRNWRRGERKGVWGKLIAFTVPSLAVLAIWIGMCAATEAGVAGTLRKIKAKGALAFTQNFSFTYFQQHPETEGNVWLESPRIAEQEFGAESVSLHGAFRRNPKAFGKHIKINLENLLPGVQLGFFNIRSAERNPEMYPTMRAPALAWTGTGVLFLVWGIGGCILYRDRKFFQKTTFRRNSLAWVCLLGFFIQAIPVSVLILARPSFYLSGIAALFAFTALCAWAIWRYFPRVLRWEGWIMVVAAIALFIIPSPWSYRERPYDVPMAIFDALGERREIMAETGTHLVAPLYQPRAMALYLDPESKILVDGMDTLLPALDSGEPLGKWLYDRRVKLFLACGAEVIGHEAYKRFEKNPGEFGWMLTGKHTTGAVSWSLFEPSEPYPEDRVKMEQPTHPAGE